MAISIESLLNMTSQQLADASTQTLRAKQRNSALQESQLKQSIQESLEAKCRVTMAGHETWRSKDSNMLSERGVSLTTSGDVNNSSNNNGDNNNLTLDTTADYEINLNDMSEGRSTNSPRSQTGGSSPNSLHSHQQQLLSDTDYSSDYSNISSKSSSTTTASSSSNNNMDNKKPKRPLNVDAGMRTTTDRPKKIKTEDESVTTASSTTTSFSTTAAGGPSSPRDSSNLSKTKAPNVLELLKASASEKKTSNAAIAYKLINSSGGTLFSISRPGSPAIDCVCCLADK